MSTALAIATQGIGTDALVFASQGFLGDVATQNGYAVGSLPTVLVLEPEAYAGVSAIGAFAVITVYPLLYGRNLSTNPRPRQPNAIAGEQDSDFTATIYGDTTEVYPIPSAGNSRERNPAETTVEEEAKKFSAKEKAKRIRIT